MCIPLLLNVQHLVKGGELRGINMVKGAVMQCEVGDGMVGCRNHHNIFVMKILNSQFHTIPVTKNCIPSSAGP